MNLQLTESQIAMLEYVMTQYRNVVGVGDLETFGWVADFESVLDAVREDDDD